MSASCVETVVAWCRSNAFQAASRGVDTKCTIGRASSANTSSVFITQLIQSTWAVHLACEVRIQITWIVLMAERLSVERPRALRQLHWKQCKGIMENLETDSHHQIKPSHAHSCTPWCASSWDTYSHASCTRYSCCRFSPRRCGSIHPGSHPRLGVTGLDLPHLNMTRCSKCAYNLGPCRTCWDSGLFCCHKQCTRLKTDRSSNAPAKKKMGQPPIHDFLSTNARHVNDMIWHNSWGTST